MLFVVSSSDRSPRTETCGESRHVDDGAGLELVEVDVRVRGLDRRRDVASTAAVETLPVEQARAERGEVLLGTDDDHGHGLPPGREPSRHGRVEGLPGRRQPRAGVLEVRAAGGEVAERRRSGSSGTCSTSIDLPPRTRFVDAVIEVALELDRRWAAGPRRGSTGSRAPRRRRARARGRSAALPPPPSVFDATPACSARAAAAKAQPAVKTTAPPSRPGTEAGAVAGSEDRRPPPTGSAARSSRPRAGRRPLGGVVATPRPPRTARRRRCRRRRRGSRRGGPISCDDVAAHADVVGGQHEDPRAQARAAGVATPTRATVLPTTAAGRRAQQQDADAASTAARSPSARRRSTSSTSLLSTATRSAAPWPSIAIPAPTSVTTFSFTIHVTTGVRSAIPVPERSWTRLPVIRTWPGATVKPPGGDDDPVGAGRRVPVAEAVDDVRVDRRVGADDDPVAARRDLVADDVERPAGRDDPGRDDRRPARPRAPRCPRRGTSRGTPTARRGRSRGRGRRRRCPRRAGRPRTGRRSSPPGRVDPRSGRRGRCGAARAPGRRPRARPPSRRRLPTSRTRGRRGPGASSSTHAAQPHRRGRRDAAHDREVLDRERDRLRAR